jgi:hypothetical protein
VRKILITLAVLVAVGATIPISWLFVGREISLRIDGWRTVKTSSTPIRSIAYEGSGIGGILVVNDLRLDLTPADQKTEAPHVGTTKEGQVALSFGGKVFPFGPSPQASDEKVTATPQPGDIAFIETSHSMIDWIELFRINFLTGQSSSWRRHFYYRIAWRKPSGAKLDLMWRYEQHFRSETAWGSGLMTREGSTGLISVSLTKTDQ